MAAPWTIVARREYTEGVRSRWFVVVTLLGPLLFAGILALPVYLQVRGAGRPLHIALVDESRPPIGDLVAVALSTTRPAGDGAFFVDRVAPSASAEAALDARVAQGDIEGYVVLPPDVATAGHAKYFGTDASSQVDMARLSARIETAVIDARARKLGLRPADTRALLAHVDLDTQQANGENASGAASFAAAYAAAITLYMTILLYGVSVMRSVIQEKTSRVLEVVVSCASPASLLVGKIVGVGAVGLTQLGCWIAGAAAILALRGPLAASVGLHGAGAIPLPSIGAESLAVLVTYFLGGYVLYSTVFAAVGAANNNEREAQQAQMPITFLLVGAFLCFPAVTSAPRDPSSVVLTMIPFFSPVLMPMRAMLTPVPAWQLALSIALLGATIAGVTWAATRVYRVGILMYGKKPGLGELLRWVRQSGG